MGGFVIVKYVNCYQRLIHINIHWPTQFSLTELDFIFTWRLKNIDSRYIRSDKKLNFINKMRYTCHLSHIPPLLANSKEINWVGLYNNLQIIFKTSPPLKKGGLPATPTPLARSVNLEISPTSTPKGRSWHWPTQKLVSSNFLNKHFKNIDCC